MEMTKSIHKKYKKDIQQNFKMYILFRNIKHKKVHTCLTLWMKME